MLQKGTITKDSDLKVEISINLTERKEVLKNRKKEAVRMKSSESNKAD
jgi:hypothetical protein